MNISELSSASPDMDDAGRAALAESIRAIGQQVPILVWRGAIIDGRKRWAACETLGVTPLTHDIGDDADPAQYATALNLCRTHYTPSQCAAFASRVANVTPADSVRFSRGASSPNCDSLVSIDQAAAAFGVHRSRVAAAKRIRREAAPEVIAAVERGDITLHKAAQVAQLPVEEQPQKVAELATLPKEKRRSATVLSMVKDPVRRGKRVDPTQATENIFFSLGALADVLESTGPAATPSPTQAREWLATFDAFIRAARPVVARLRREYASTGT